MEIEKEGGEKKMFENLEMVELEVVLIGLGKVLEDVEVLTPEELEAARRLYDVAFDEAEAR